MEIQEFIKTYRHYGRDWKAALAEKPYCIDITEAEWNGFNLVMLKYSQIESDFNVKLVRECRGLILDEDTLEPVSYAFDKFGNINESYIPNLDAASMFSTVKVDGSIIKIVKKNGRILISTNGTINAYTAPVAEQIGCPFKSFGDIVESILKSKFGSMESFYGIIDEGYTYIFEMVSPWTRVVTPFKENDLYLIGCRKMDRDTGYPEIFFKDCPLSKYFKTPDILDFSSVDKCLAYASSLDWTNEGYVMMDKFFNRVKVKNPSWLAVHHLSNNHVMSYERAIELVQSNEIDEVVGYFPEFEAPIREVQKKYDDAVSTCSREWIEFSKLNTAGTFADRKAQAIHILKHFGQNTGFAFAMLDKKAESAEKWFHDMPAFKLARQFGYKESK